MTVSDLASLSAKDILAEDRARGPSGERRLPDAETALVEPAHAHEVAFEENAIAAALNWTYRPPRSQSQTPSKPS
jgi:hypothetical protein